jgi:hypothetical protein
LLAYGAICKDAGLTCVRDGVADDGAVFEGATPLRKTRVSVRNSYIDLKKRTRKRYIMKDETRESLELFIEKAVQPH